MKFDLSKLGPREFENLTQTLAIAEIGSALTIFGPGPDGGREATFDGVVTLGKDGPTVDGYGVIQAKYCENQTTPQKDATWLIGQIRSELKEWKESPKRAKKPDCLIFVTNVTLSGVARTGGIDRVDKELKAHCKALGIKEWYVWHGETINRLLEKNTEIRTSYAAWILPGDVLAELYSQVSERKKAIGKGLQRYLARELVRDLHVNLDQAGSADDLKIPLAEVFIDLPIGPPGRGNPNASNVLRKLISTCDGKFSTHTSGNKKAGHGRYVLVGGPGQGKSTVSQFLCQIYRARLIAGSSVGRSAEVAQAVELITNQAAREGLTPNSHRWPVKVPLTQLADELARGSSKSLLQFIASRASDAADVIIAPQDLREWLATFPWLLLLDGLDEVPASSNRDQVLTAVNEFLMDVEEVSADVMVIATTRPQGYTEEFSPSRFLHLELKSLDKERALHYAKKLATARHGADSERTSRLMGRLNQAADEESTARLMSSPLQVTIMAVLLDRMGKAPKDRYTLFKDYYRVIYERELEKEGASTNLLRDHRADIDAIHADVGLLLQTRSERSGDTESRISVEEFGTIIRQRLDGEGHTGSALESLSELISLAATDRLVFLVPSRANEVGFEIRSLQEFWAADALMSASDEEVRERLGLISASAHWRNVFLFAVGKIFTERRHLRDSVNFVVAELNTYARNPLASTRRLALGSRLAVDILADGMVKAPKHEAVLVDQAAKLFGIPAINAVERLVPGLSESGRQTAREAVDNWLHEGKKVTESLLVFLAGLMSKGDEWAERTLESIYGDSDERTRRRFLELAFELSSAELLRFSADEFLSVPIGQFQSILSARWRRQFSRPLLIGEGPAWLTKLISFSEQVSLPLDYTSSVLVGGLRMTFEIPKIGDHPLWADLDLSGVPSGHWMHSVRAFAEDPSPASLMDSVLAVDVAQCEPFKGTSFLPWPIAAALQDMRDGVTPRDQLDSASYVGDLASWRRIEESWQDPMEWSGLAANLKESVRDGADFLPFSANVSRVFDSPPPGGVVHYLDSVLQELSLSPPSRIKSYVADMALSSASMYHRRSWRSAETETLKAISELALESASHVDLTWVSGVKRLPPGTGAWLNDILRERHASVWLTVIPPVLFREWIADYSQIELGKALCTGDFGSIPKVMRTALSREWRRIAHDASMDIRRKGAVCLAVSFFEPCRDEADCAARIETLAAASEARVFDPGFVALHVILGHEPLQQKMMLGFIDSLPGIDYDVSEMAMDRLVADEASVPTRIDFPTMRAR
ncbi:NACHT domain-containing protein [Streptomyces mirabilis]|uniref:NACHT domain-containing protein n=1 Tax=Streptomyces mirabilis TaxID=68239 RepID=UPI0035DF9734